MHKLNDLPTVIDGPGDYVTRNGSKVTIRTVSPPGLGDATRFAAKGNIWRMFRGKVRPVDFAIWHISGRYMPLRELSTDIVGKWPTI